MTGSTEAALTVLAVAAHQIAPPTANFSCPEPGTSVIDLVVGAARMQDIRLALSDSCGFGGRSTAPAFRPAGSRTADSYC
ncbi:hypothetical protein ACWGCW_03655 [Streptomyces sp. NPDC054933]